MLAWQSPDMGLYGDDEAKMLAFMLCNCYSVDGTPVVEEL